MYISMSNTRCNLTIVICGDLSVLSSEITNLTRLRAFGVARNLLPTDEGIQVSQGEGAVSVSWDWLVVNVVGEWATFLGKASKLNLNLDTTISRRGSEDDSSAQLGVFEVCKIFLSSRLLRVSLSISASTGDLGGVPLDWCVDGEDRGGKEEGGNSRLGDYLHFDCLLMW